MLVKFGLWIPIFSMIPDSLACIPGSKAQDSRFHRFPRDGARRERLYSQRPSFLFFHHLWQCVEFHWLQAPLGVSLSFSFPFLHSCARVLDISPFALIKPGACYASYNNLKVESVNSVTNCILMSDPLVLFFNKNQRASYIHKSINYFWARYQKLQFSTKKENKTGRLPALLVNFLFLLWFSTPYRLLGIYRCNPFSSFLFQPCLSVNRKNILRLLT